MFNTLSAFLTLVGIGGCGQTVVLVGWDWRRLARKTSVVSHSRDWRGNKIGTVETSLLLHHDLLYHFLHGHGRKSKSLG